jgi:hypothetical protein
MQIVSDYFIEMSCGHTMKVAIITLHRVFNYGSVLQAYATQKVIESLGHEAEVIDYITEQRTNRILFLSVPDFIKKDFLHKYTYTMLKSISVLMKKASFGRFINQNIKLTKQKYITAQDLKKDPPAADVYVTGSDQVWNSQYNKGIDKGFFLEFAPDKCKKIAFVSSFGKGELSPEESGETKRLIHRYNAISVREDTALEILEGLEYSNAVCLIDPTLQIEREHWFELAAKRLVKEKYLLLMLLYNEDNGAAEYAQKIAQQRGLKVVKISWEYKKPSGVDLLMTHRSPQEFLSLFQHAEFVVTNSFHGLAFCLNMNKQFIVVPRNEFNTRIESLLRLVHLEDRMISEVSQLTVVNKLIKYDTVNSILDDERQRAKLFLSEALQ